MDDTELIKFASMASGFAYSEASNPLVDDALALRLAVKLGLMIDIQNKVNATSVWTTDESGSADFDAAHGKDPYAATRRAIVRAAAEIGKAMP